MEDDFEDLLGDGAAPSDPVAKNSAARNLDSRPSRPNPPGKRKAAPAAAHGHLPDYINAEQMAALLGLSTGRVYELARNRIVPRKGRALYPVPDAPRAYAEYIRKNPIGREPKKSKGSDEALAAEKLRLAREQADALELKNAAARGELVKASTVEKEWADVLRDVRAAMLAVPSRVGAVCPHMSKTDLAELDRQIRSALEGLADGT